MSLTDELRSLLEARDNAKGDGTLARRAATLAHATGDRALAAHSWQEVLRRIPRDPESEQRLAALGCELLFRGENLGVERYANVRDGAILARSPALPGVFVATEPVTNGRFERFLAARGTDPMAPSWVARVPSCPHRWDGARWTFRGTGRPDPAHHASFRGGAAYALWAGGRLIRLEERAKLDPRAFAWGPREWFADAREDAEARTLHATGGDWLADDAPFEAVAFRYARDSWFASG